MPRSVRIQSLSTLPAPADLEAGAPAVEPETPETPETPVKRFTAIDIPFEIISIAAWDWIQACTAGAAPEVFAFRVFFATIWSLTALVVTRRRMRDPAHHRPRSFMPIAIMTLYVTLLVARYSVSNAFFRLSTPHSCTRPSAESRTPGCDGSAPLNVLSTAPKPTSFLFALFVQAHGLVVGCPRAVGGLWTERGCASIGRHEFPADLMLLNTAVVGFIVQRWCFHRRGRNVCSVYVIVGVFAALMVGVVVVVAPWDRSENTSLRMDTANYVGMIAVVHMLLVASARDVMVLLVHTRVEAVRAASFLRRAQYETEMRGLLEAKNRELEATRQRLERRRQGERVVYHHVKNDIVSAYATIELFLDETDAEVTTTHLRHSSKKLAASARFIHNSLSVAKILEGSHVPKPKQVDVAEWLRTNGPVAVQCSGAASTCRYVLAESVVPELFLGCCLDNATRHGAGDTRAHCTYDAGKRLLRVDISNKVSTAAAGEGTGGDLSTGLGLQDLREICSRRQIPFTSGLRNDDGRWHSVIDLEAEPVIASSAGESKSAETKSAVAGREAGHPKHIVIVDDQGIILKLLCKRFKRRFPSAIVHAFHLNTAAAFADFMEQTVPQHSHAWDLLLLDQNLQMMGSGRNRQGTEILSAVKAAGCNGCFVMHSANSTARFVCEGR